MTLRDALFIACAAIALVACRDDSSRPIDPDATVALVRVAPEAIAIDPGGSVTLVVTAFDAAGSLIVGRPVRFHVLDDSVATVNPAGRVSAISPAQTRVFATIEGVTGSASVRVREVAQPVAEVRLTPSGEMRLEPLATAQLAATAHAADGSLLAGRHFAWESVDEGVVTVDANGLASAHAVGTTFVAAVCEGQRDEMLVRVLPAATRVAAVEIDAGDALSLSVGEAIALGAVPRAADGTVVTGWTLVWSSEAPSIVSVDEFGLVTAIGPGVTFVRATVDGVVGRIEVVVSGWSDHFVITVNDLELPATIETYTESLPGGGTRTVRVEVDVGLLRMDLLDGRFTFEWFGSAYPTGARPYLVRYDVAGWVTRDSTTSVVRLLPDEIGLDPSFATPRVGGGYELAWQPVPTVPARRFGV